MKYAKNTTEFIVKENSASFFQFLVKLQPNVLPVDVISMSLITNGNSFLKKLKESALPMSFKGGGNVQPGGKIRPSILEPLTPKMRIIRNPISVVKVV